MRLVCSIPKVNWLFSVAVIVYFEHILQIFLELAELLVKEPKDKIFDYFFLLNIFVIRNV